MLELKKSQKRSIYIAFYVVNLQHKEYFYYRITVILDVLLCYGNKAKIKLKAKKYNPATRKHEVFVEKKLPPHSK